MKIKWFGCLIIFVLSFKISKAQESNDSIAHKVSGLSVMIGPSFPLGVYADTDPYNASSGYAMTGFNFSISCNVALSYDQGLCFLMSSISNKIDENKMTEQYKYLLQSYPLTGLHVETTNWKTTSYLIGGYYAFFANRTSILLKALVGYSSSESPEQKVSFTQSQSPYSGTVRQFSSTGNSLAFDLGSTAYYNFKGNIFIDLGVEYFRSDPKFIVSVSSPTQYVTAQFEQPIQALNISAGLGFNF